MKPVRTTILAAALTLSCATAALATPSGQINIPSTDAKALKEVTINVSNYVRFSSAPDAGPNLYNVGVVAGLLPFEAVKAEIGIDYMTTGTGGYGDKHPISFNAKLATAEDILFKGMPAFAIGMYNMGTYDKPEAAETTRQNIAYGLVAKTLPVVGRLSAGGYYGAERALGHKTNSGILASWDRTISEVSDKLWLAVDYMSGNNGNGEISTGASWAFSKQITLLGGVTWYNPFYKTSNGESIPGGKPTFTTQLYINF